LDSAIHREPCRQGSTGTESTFPAQIPAYPLTWAHDQFNMSVSLGEKYVESPKRESAMFSRGFCTILFCGLIFVGSAMANVYGPPVVNYGNLDTCAGCAFPLVQITAGQTVASYSFYDGQSAASSNYLTPLLFEETAPGTFSMIGIGASSTGFTANAVNTETFTLAGGTATAGADTFFGYLDGQISGQTGTTFTFTGNAGTVSTTYPGNGGPDQYFLGNGGSGPGSLTLGSSTAANSFVGVGQATRTYALDVTTTPEPGFYGLMALGLSGLGIVVSRRRKANKA
jgi:hypothetical protein